MSGDPSPLAQAIGQLRRDRAASRVMGEDQSVVPVTALDALLSAAGGGEGRFDLAARAAEILAWRRTGRYSGTELQRMADSLADQDQVDPPIARAELLTIKEVLQFVAAFQDPDRHAG